MVEERRSARNRAFRHDAILVGGHDDQAVLGKQRKGAGLADARSPDVAEEIRTKQVEGAGQHTDDSAARPEYGCCQNHLRLPVEAGAVRRRHERPAAVKHTPDPGTVAQVYRCASLVVRHRRNEFSVCGDHRERVELTLQSRPVLEILLHRSGAAEFFGGQDLRQADERVQTQHQGLVYVVCNARYERELLGFQHLSQLDLEEVQLDRRNERKQPQERRRGDQGDPRFDVQWFHAGPVARFSSAA